MSARQDLVKKLADDPGAIVEQIAKEFSVTTREVVEAMQVDSKISNTEKGPKAFLLKVMEPFFKKKKKGEIVPVRISGTYGHPSFGLDLNDKKAQTVPEPTKNSPPSPR